jgi:hypothetical protein
MRLPSVRRVQNTGGEKVSKFGFQNGPMRTEISDSSVPSVKVLSQLMQNHRLATPVTGDSQLSVTQDPTGQLELFSIGSSGHVCQTYQDEDSDTGWSLRDLQYPGVAAFLACVTNPDKSVNVAAADGNLGVYLLQLPATFSETLPPWIQLPAMNIRGIRAGVGPDGSSVICIYNGQDNNFYMLGGSNGSYNWGSGLQTVQTIPPTTDWQYSQVFDTDDWSGPAPGIVWTGGDYGSQPAVQSRGWWGGSGYGPYAPGSYTIVSVIPDLQGYWDVFAINSADLGVYYLHSPVGSDSSEFAVIKVSDDTACTTVAAGRFTPIGPSEGPPILLEAFSLSTSGILYQVQQNPDTTSGWGDFTALAEDLTFTQICVGVNGEGNSELFAVAINGTLYHIWQDAATTDWNFDEVEVATAGQLEDVPSYQTVINVLDAAGLPMPFVPATLACPNSDNVPLAINGEDVTVGPNSPWSGTTNGLGNIVINQATTGLGSPVLQVAVDGVPEIPPIDASGTVQTTLVNVTGQQLIDNVLPPQFQQDAEAVAQGVRQALAMIPQQPATARSVHPRSDFRVFAANYGRIDASAIADQHWAFDVLSGRPRFRTLRPAEAAALIAEANALPKLDGSILGTLYDAWGAVVSAVEHGVATIAQWVVSGAQAVLTLVINGIQYVFTAAISLVEQALDLAQQILSTVQVWFQQLFAWLGYIFNWQNILRTQEAMVYTVNQVLQFFQEAASTIKTNIDSSLQSFVQNQLAAVFTAAEQQLGTATTFGEYQSAKTVPLQGFDSPAAQLIGNHLVQNSANAAPACQAQRLGVPSSLQAVVDQVTNLASTYGVNQKVTEALAFFQAAANSPDSYLQLTLSGILAVVEAGIVAVIAGVQLVADAVLDAIGDVMSGIQVLFNQEWDIPVVSDIYQRMTISDTNPDGLPLTALSLLGLLVAMPATVVYTAVNGTAPFPDDDSLAAFEAGFTSTMLLQNSGLAGAQQPAPTGVRNAGAAGGTWSQIFAYMRAGTLTITSIVEPFIDLQIPDSVNQGQLTKFKPPQLSDASYKILGLSVLLLEVCNVGLSVPWVEGSISWSPATSGGWLSYGWCKDALKLVADTVFFLVTDALPRQVGDPGTWFEFFSGFLDIPSAVGYLITGGNGWSGAAGIVGGVGDILRVCRDSYVVVGTGGMSLLVLMESDLVGNLVEAALAIESVPSSSAVASTSL